MPDRQTQPSSWTWMDLNLSNGDKVSLWDQRGKTRNAFATILSPDGTHTVTTVTTAYDPSSLWTSPVSGNRYATRWTVTIPARHATLTVTVTADNQELLAPFPRYEGSAKVTGTYGGHHVTGYTYAEAFAVK
nr:lipocalin family protein [Actinoplanes subtropicus]